MNVIIVVAIACLLIGLSKGGLGGPVPVALVTPLLSQVMPASQAVGIALPLLMFADLFALKFYWRQWDGQQIKLMLPAGLVGVLIGSLLLVTLANSGQNVALRRILGVFTLIVVIYKVGGNRLTALHYTPHNWHGYLAGITSGFGSALANVGAPPFTAYMLLQEVTPTAFIGTTTLFFAIINAAKLPGVLSSQNVLNLEQLVGILWAVPLIPMGVWLGRRFINIINPKAFENLMLVLLFGASLTLLFSAS
ncbi:MAG: sulfite exporter TauE/SafE family protein [Anaerolineaceae bacterium]|nr:sulfite exporter TauE/SafE family protein [Anaerolineaceae bacterium]